MKSVTTLLKITTTLLALGSLTACSGFSSASGGSSATGSTNNGQSTGGGDSSSSTGTTTNPIDSVDLSGYANGGLSDGALVVSFDKTTMALTLSVPITLSGLNLSLSASVPNYPDIQIYNYTDANNISYMAVRVPVKYILQGINFGNPSLMPNGQVLPFLGGELPSTAIVINATSNSKFYLYIGSGAVAVYVSSPVIPSYISAYYNIRNKAGTKVIGTVGIAAKTTVGDGGFVVSARIPDEDAKIIDDYFGSL